MFTIYKNKREANSTNELNRKKRPGTDVCITEFLANSIRSDFAAFRPATFVTIYFILLPPLPFRRCYHPRLNSPLNHTIPTLFIRIFPFYLFIIFR